MSAQEIIDLDNVTLPITPKTDWYIPLQKDPTLTKKVSLENFLNELGGPFLPLDGSETMTGILKTGNFEAELGFVKYGKTPANAPANSDYYTRVNTLGNLVTNVLPAKSFEIRESGGVIFAVSSVQINARNHQIVNLAMVNPIESTDAVNVGYLNTQIDNALLDYLPTDGSGSMTGAVVLENSSPTIDANKGALWSDGLGNVLINAQTSFGIRFQGVAQYSFSDAALSLSGKNLQNVPFISDANGKMLLGFETTDNANTYLTITNSLAGQAPILSVDGSATNLPLLIQAKGTSDVQIGSNLDLNGNIITQSTGDFALVVENPVNIYKLEFGTGTPVKTFVVDKDKVGFDQIPIRDMPYIADINNAKILEFVAATTAANFTSYLEIENAQNNVTPNSVIIRTKASQGLLAPLKIESMGTAMAVTIGNMQTPGPENKIADFIPVNVPDAYFKFTNAIQGEAPEMSVDGTDANIDLILAPKGTGIVQVNGGIDMKGSALRNVIEIQDVYQKTQLLFETDFNSVSGTLAYLAIKNGKDGSQPRIKTMGFGNDINLLIEPKGRGQLQLLNGVTFSKRSGTFSPTDVNSGYIFYRDLGTPTPDQLEINVEPLSLLALTFGGNTEYTFGETAFNVLGNNIADSNSISFVIANPAGIPDTATPSISFVDGSPDFMRFQVPNNGQFKYGIGNVTYLTITQAASFNMSRYHNFEVVATDPSTTPTATDGNLYLKTVGSTAHLFFQNSEGVTDLLAGGGGGAFLPLAGNTELTPMTGSIFMGTQTLEWDLGSSNNAMISPSGDNLQFQNSAVGGKFLFSESIDAGGNEMFHLPSIAGQTGTTILGLVEIASANSWISISSGSAIQAPIIQSMNGVTGDVNLAIGAQEAGIIILGSPIQVDGQANFQEELFMHDSLQTRRVTYATPVDGVLVLSGGNFFRLTNGNNIFAITTTGWQYGSQITFRTTAVNTTFFDNQSPGGAGVAPIIMPDGFDVSLAAGECITFVYDTDGVNDFWVEINRSKDYA